MYVSFLVAHSELNPNHTIAVWGLAYRRTPPIFGSGNLPLVEHRGFVLGFCEAQNETVACMLRKILRSPLQNNSQGCFVRCVRIPYLKIELKQEKTHICASSLVLVEHRGFEPLTPTLPVLCAPNCANAPWVLLYMKKRDLSTIIFEKTENFSESWNRPWHSPVKVL